MKNTMIISLVVLGVVSSASIGHAETYGRYLGGSYSQGALITTSKPEMGSTMAPAQTYGRYIGSRYVVSEPVPAASQQGFVARPEFQKVDRINGVTYTIINGTVKSVNISKGFFIAEDKASSREKLIYVPDTKILKELNVGQNVSAVLQGSSPMATSVSKYMKRIGRAALKGCLSNVLVLKIRKILTMKSMITMNCRKPKNRMKIAKRKDGWG
jgi:hypothetical protein